MKMEGEGKKGLEGSGCIDGRNKFKEEYKGVRPYL
jgi:hypothetical protein